MAYRIGVVGAAGRLGSHICGQSEQFDCAVTLVGRREGWDVQAIPEVLIDVSHARAFSKVAEFCAQHRIPLVEGVSTTVRERRDDLARLSTSVPVVVAPNFSLGHFLQGVVLRNLASLLRQSGEPIEFTVAERHPTYKPDRPSATANSLAQMWTANTSLPAADISSVRGGLPVSDHEFSITLSGEQVRVTHSVVDRDAAARGALRAAVWLITQPVGTWGMSDVYESLFGIATIPGTDYCEANR